MTLSTTVAGATLSDRAVLVDLNISKWTASKHDAKVSREVADNHGSDIDFGRFNKRLVAKAALARIAKAAADAHEKHYAMTLPWLNAGGRILNSSACFEYARVMRECEAEYEAAVDEFVANYPQFVDDARRRLNGLFDPSEYPAPSQIRSRFSFGYNTFPVPDAADFRVDLGQDVIDRLNDARDRAALEGVRDVYGRIIKVVEHMASSLRDYKVTADGVEHPFRDSLVENVRELAMMLPILNVMGDPELQAISDRVVDQLCRHSAGKLRASEAARAEVAAAAEAILAQASEFLA